MANQSFNPPNIAVGFATEQFYDREKPNIKKRFKNISRIQRSQKIHCAQSNDNAIGKKLFLFDKLRVALNFEIVNRTSIYTLFPKTIRKKNKEFREFKKLWG